MCGDYKSWRKFTARPTQNWPASKFAAICTRHYVEILESEEKHKQATKAYERYLVEQREWERKVEDNNISNSGKNRETLRNMLHAIRSGNAPTDNFPEYVIQLIKHFTEISGYDSAILYGPNFCKELAQICYNHATRAYIFENVDWNNIS